jgi:hypothetical protein
MSERPEIHLVVDPMLYLAGFIEDNLETIDHLKTSGDIFGAPEFAGAVAEVGHDAIAHAHEQLEAMIAADKTWQPAYGTPCAMVLDGYDDDGTAWGRCTVHGYLVLGDAYVCEGYEAPPYTGKH